MPTLVIPESFDDELRTKPSKMVAKISKCLQLLGTDPFGSPGLRTKKLKGTEDVWSARIDQANRVTFHWKDDTIVLRKHCHHDILKNP